MRFYPECYPCTLRQIIQICKLLDLPEPQQIQYLQKFMVELSQIDPGLSPPEIAAHTYKIFAQEMKFTEQDFDPYRHLKAKANEEALLLYPVLKEYVAQSGQPIATACRIAAAGNVIDLGVYNHDELDLQKELDQITQVYFYHDDTNLFLEKLPQVKKLLVIGDNAGEIVFDKILIETIKEHYPALRVVYAVRGGPIINDATLADVAQVGLDKVCEVMTSGNRLPGTVLAKCISEFCDVFAEAELVLSKGQGNYETLSENKHQGLLFLLKIKCDLVARHLAKPLGEIIFYKAHS